jgi:hypothetical protein
MYYRHQTWSRPRMPYDKVAVSLTFRSTSFVQLRTVSSSELVCTTNLGWCVYNNVFPLPIGTRSVDYIMTFIRKGTVGTNIDCYIDNNSLRII